jgi:uncharacterized protein (DUF2267 family)
MNLRPYIESLQRFSLDEGERGQALENSLRDLLRRIASAARARYKTESPDDLGDELEEMLERVSLAKPPLLSKSQYDAVAEVWEALTDNLTDVEAAAGRALMRVSE